MTRQEKKIASKSGLPRMGDAVASQQERIYAKPGTERVTDTGLEGSRAGKQLNVIASSLCLLAVECVSLRGYSCSLLGVGGAKVRGQRECQVYDHPS